MSGSPRPTRLGELVEGVLKDAGLHEQVRRQSVLESWADDVGSGIAEVTRAVRVDGKVLFVEVRSSAWLMELNMMKRAILERVNRGREEGRVDSIRFRLQEEGHDGDAGDASSEHET